MKKLSLMAALCIAGFAYATATEKETIIENSLTVKTRVSEQDTTKRKPDTTRIPRTPDRRIPMPSDPGNPQRPIPTPGNPNMPNPSPSPTPAPIPTDPRSPAPIPSPTNPSPSPTGPR